MKILLVDDEHIKRTALCDDLSEAGYQVRDVADAEAGLRALEAELFDVVVTDLRMKGMDGLGFLGKIKERWPETDVVMITAYATVDNAVQAMKLGAFDYLTKPFESAKLVMILNKISRIRQLTSENRDLKEQLAQATRPAQIIGQSESMRKALSMLDSAIASDIPVLLYGESGTGKELFASAIHQCGPRKDKPFICTSCAALPPQLMESELFGHELGAFTGAVKARAGRFELAHQGTLFLDEIDDVPLDVQVKLLRVLEGHPFERVGGTNSMRTNVRLVAASKVDLKHRVEEGAFRNDLYYRLSVFPIPIPPLRERMEDIPLLVQHFVRLYGPAERVPSITEDALELLMRYAWPGNVRELQNVVRRILLGLGPRAQATAADLPSEVRMACWSPPIPAPPSDSKTFREAIAANEHDMLLHALERAAGNQSKAAATLGMKLSTFRDKLCKHGIRAGRHL